MVYHNNGCSYPVVNGYSNNRIQWLTSPGILPPHATLTGLAVRYRPKGAVSRSLDGRPKCLGAGLRLETRLVLNKQDAGGRQKDYRIEG